MLRYARLARGLFPLALLFFAHTAAAKPAAPKPAACPAAGTEPVAIGRVVSGISFTDARGVEILLAGIIAPKGDADALEPLRAALAGHALKLAPAAAADRYGRKPAQVFADGLWLQLRLVQDGLARVLPDGPSAPCAKSLLAAEDEARTKHAGHWGDGVFRTYAASDVGALRRRVGSFEIVEGKILSAALVGNRAYLNFGEDRKTDFTITIAPENLHNAINGKARLMALEGQRVRVRGWIESFNGPEMEIAHAEALEMLDPITPDSAFFKVPRPKHKPRIRKTRESQTHERKPREHHPRERRVHDDGAQEDDAGGDAPKKKTARKHRSAPSSKSDTEDDL